MFDWSTIAAALIAAITSVPVWNLLNRITGRGATELDRLRLRIVELEQKERSYEAEVVELKARLAIVEHHHASHFARWIRDATKRLIWANSRAQITLFAPLGFTRWEDLEGKDFADIFDIVACREIDLLDRAALATPGLAVSSIIQLHPDLPLMHVVKVAAAGREGELIYEGIAFRTNDPVMADSRGIHRQHVQLGNSFDNVLKDPPPPAD